MRFSKGTQRDPLIDTEKVVTKIRGNKPTLPDRRISDRRQYREGCSARSMPDLAGAQRYTTSALPNVVWSNRWWI